MLSRHRAPQPAWKTSAAWWASDGGADDTSVSGQHCRLAAAIPAANLKDFVGVVGVYGHVNDILGDNMLAYASFVEHNELADIQKARSEGRAAAADSLKESWATYDVSGCSLSPCFVVRYTKVGVLRLPRGAAGGRRQPRGKLGHL